MPLVPVGESENDLQMKNKFENNENAYLPLLRSKTFKNRNSIPIVYPKTIQ